MMTPDNNTNSHDAKLSGLDPTVKTESSKQLNRKIKPFVRENPYPHEIKLYYIALISFLVLAHLRIISVWFVFFLGFFYIAPNEIKKVREYGFKKYVKSLYFKKPSIKDLGIIGFGLISIFILLFTLIGVLVFLSQLSTKATPSVETVEQGGHLISTAVINWWIYVSVVISMYLIVGPIEELVFRHKLQNKLKKRFPTVIAIVLTNGIFAILHLPVLVFSSNLLLMIIPLIGIFIVGTVFSVQYESTRNLLVPSLTHSTYNSILLTLLFLA